MDSSDSEMQTRSYVKPQLSIKKYCKKINKNSYLYMITLPLEPKQQPIAPVQQHTEQVNTNKNAKEQLAVPTEEQIKKLQKDLDLLLNKNSNDILMAYGGILHEQGII